MSPAKVSVRQARRRVSPAKVNAHQARRRVSPTKVTVHQTRRHGIFGLASAACWRGRARRFVPVERRVVAVVLVARIVPLALRKSQSD